MSSIPPKLSWSHYGHYLRRISCETSGLLALTRAAEAVSTIAPLDQALARQYQYPWCCCQCLSTAFQRRMLHLPRTSRSPILASMADIERIDPLDQRLGRHVRSDSSAFIPELYNVQQEYVVRKQRSAIPCQSQRPQSSPFA